MDDDGAVELLGAAERVLQFSDVVAVDRPDVLQAQVLEHALRGNDVLEALLHPVQGPVDGLADDGRALEHLLAPRHEPLVVARRAKGRQVMRKAADSRRVRPSVVVHDDDDLAIGAGDVVQRLPGHAAGQPAIADNRHDVLGAEKPALLPCLGDAVCVRQRGRGMRILDNVMDALGAARIPGKSALLAELVELLNATGEHLVDVGLMSGIPNHDVLRRPEDAMQCNGEFDHTEVRAKVAAGRRDFLDEEGPDLLRELRHLLYRQRTDIIGIADSTKKTHARSLPGEAPFGA